MSVKCGRSKWGRWQVQGNPQLTHRKPTTVVQYNMGSYCICGLGDNLCFVTCMGKRRRDTSASPSVDELRRALLVLVQRTAWSFASPATAAGARGGLGGNASPLARSRVLGTDVVQHETLLYRSGVVLRVRHHVSEGAADTTSKRRPQIEF